MRRISPFLCELMAARIAKRFPSGREARRLRHRLLMRLSEKLYREVRRVR